MKTWGRSPAHSISWEDLLRTPLESPGIRRASLKSNIWFCDGPKSWKQQSVWGLAHSVSRESLHGEQGCFLIVSCPTPLLPGTPKHYLVDTTAQFSKHMLVLGSLSRTPSLPQGLGVCCACLCQWQESKAFIRLLGGNEIILMGNSSNPHPGLRACLWHLYPWVICLLTPCLPPGTRTSSSSQPTQLDNSDLIFVIALYGGYFYYYLIPILQMRTLRLREYRRLPRPQRATMSQIQNWHRSLPVSITCRFCSYLNEAPTFAEYSPGPHGQAHPCQSCFLNLWSKDWPGNFSHSCSPILANGFENLYSLTSVLSPMTLVHLLSSPSETPSLLSCPLRPALFLLSSPTEPLTRAVEVRSAETVPGAIEKATGLFRAAEVLTLVCSSGGVWGVKHRGRRSECRAVWSEATKANSVILPGYRSPAQGCTISM